MYIYTLKLQSGKYYVGKTGDLGTRLIQHKTGNGSFWTKQYKFESLIDVYEVDNNIDLFEETKQTCKMFLKYGPKNVRGAQYCQLQEPKIDELVSYIGHNLNLNYTDVRETLLGKFEESSLEKERIEELKININKFVSEKNKFVSNDLDEQFMNACRDGRIKEVGKLHHVKNISPGLNIVIEKGNASILTYILQTLELTEQELNNALYCACKNGKLQCIDILVSRGACDFINGLAVAYSNRQLCAAVKMAELEARFEKNSESEKIDQKELDKKFANACNIGRINEVNKFLKLGAKDIGWGLNLASEKGHVNVIDRLAKIGLSENELDISLYCACKYGQIQAIDRLIEHGACDFNHGLSGACVGKKMNIIEKMVELGGKFEYEDDKINYESWKSVKNS
jgi:ankyrin repeat protein